MGITFLIGLYISPINHFYPLTGSRDFDFDLKSNGVYFNLNIQLNAQDGGFTFSADGKSDMASSDAATVKAVYTKATKLEVEFKHGSREAKLTAGFSKNEENAGTLKLTFANNFLAKLKNVQFEGTAQFTATKKATTLVSSFKTNAHHKLELLVELVEDFHLST